VFNAVTAAQTSGCLSNQGENTWISNYIVAGGTPTRVQYRLEYSYNSDAATCTTGTWFSMSDDATDLVQAEVVGIGSYPFVRANLVACAGCGGAVTFTAFFSTSSANPGTLNGFYNPSQQIRKVIFQGASAGTTATVSSIPAPYASTAGFLVVQISTFAFPGNSSMQVIAHTGAFTLSVQSFTLPTASGLAIAIPLPASPATSIDVIYTSGGASVRTFNAFYYFYPPGQTQPYGTQPMSVQSSITTNPNQEATSGLNAAVTVSLDLLNGVNTQRAHLFSVSSRCSAGTAQLTVIDGNTTHSLTTAGGLNLFTSGTAEVGTTTFKFQWNPGLASSPGNGITVTLGACGVGNTGTLDVQGSIF